MSRLKDKKERGYKELKGLHLFSTLKNYIYVRSHKRDLDGNCHKIVESKSTQSFLRDAQGKSLSREVRFSSDFRVQSRDAFKTKPFPGDVYAQKSIGTNDSRVPLPSCFSSREKTNVRLLSSASYRDKSRKQARRNRVLLLQSSTTRLIKSRQDVTSLFQERGKSLSVNTLQQKTRPPLFFQARDKIQTPKGVLKGFINTFMRNGYKVKYQGVLCKAFLSV